MRYLLHCVFGVTLTFAVGSPLSAQDPPPPVSQSDNADQQQSRIVDDRPTGYFFKRNFHPFTWIDVGMFNPAYRLGQHFMANRPAMKLPVKVGLDGAGPGSGFGPEVTLIHHTFFGRAIEVNTPLLYTYKSYQSYLFNIRMPAANSFFFLDGGYRSRPDDKFFGIGNDTPVSAEAFFKTIHREVGGGFSGGITKKLRATIGVGFDKVGVTEPGIGDSAQQMFTEKQVPGLFSGATMRSTTLTIDHNTQDDVHRATRGGLELAEAGLHESVGSEDFAYWKYRLEIQRYFSFGQNRRNVIAFRGLGETNQEKGGSRIPFFDLPYLGSWSTLRGFEDYRYRDKSALALGLEYRYRIWRALDWGLFVDRGQVASEPGDFAWSRFHTGYGTRLIMLPNPKFPISVDVGHSNEKWRLYFNFNPTF
jgi:surface antigen Omp85-like protein